METRNLKPALEILLPVCEQDIKMACACIKTLEVNPPSIDFKINLLVPEKDVLEIEPLVKKSNVLEIIPYAGSIAQTANIVLLGTEKPYAMFLHADCLFVNEQWCDATLSIIIQKDLAAISTQSFDHIELPNSKSVVQGFRGDIALMQTKMIQECGGIPSDMPDHAIALGLQARLAKMRIPFGGTDLGQFITHMNKCSLDKSKLSHDLRLQAAKIFEREYTQK